MFKKIYFVAFIAFVGIFALMLTYSKKQITSKVLHPVAASKAFEQEDNMDLAMKQEIALTKDPSTGEVPTERLISAKQIQQDRFLAQKNNPSFAPFSPVSGISWNERGPNNVGGRTRSILYDANDPNGNKVWAGSVGGGLWYNNNISDPSSSWYQVNDFFNNLAVTTIAQDPTNPQIMYFGTGEGWYNLDAIRGLGIYQTTDGGATWNPLVNTQSNPLFYFVEKIAVTSSGTILASTRGGGIQRSADGGTTWTQVAGSSVGIGASNSGSDIQIASDGAIYVTLGIFDNGGIFCSRDDGSSFVGIYTPASDEQRISISTAASNPAVIYAVIQSSTTYGLKNIIKTVNATDPPASIIWAPVTRPSWCDQGTSSADYTRGQAWYDLSVTVDPGDENTVYIGGVDVLKSTDGGTSWNQISQWGSGCSFLPNVHADIHAIVLRPSSGIPASELLIGSDGGVSRSTDYGTTFTNMNLNYNVTQYYSVAMHPTDPNYFLAGAQDNGTQKYTAPGINSTVQASGGDGAFCHIDQNNGNIQITSYVYNNYYVSTDGGVTFNGVFYGNSGSFINPTTYDNTYQTLYGGYAAGGYIRWIRPDISGPATAWSAPDFSSGSVTHVTVSPITPDRIYFGLNNGGVVRVNNASGSSPTTNVVKPTGFLSISVSGIAIDPLNEDHILVTYSNYGVGHIFESLDATSASPTWTDVSGNFPDMPVRWVMFDPRSSNSAIIATELGVWSTDNLAGGGTDWQPTNNGLANVRVDMLKYRSGDRTMAAATHGRGLFTTQIPDASFIASNQAISLNAELNSDRALLKWNSTYALNKGFEIERSVDGIHFQHLGNVEAARNGIKNNLYTFNDDHLTEQNYYRIKQIGQNDKIVYSKIALLENMKNNFKVLNNPFNSYIDLQFTKTSNQPNSARLLDLNGKEVYRMAGKNAGQSNMHLDLSGIHISSGLYILEVRENNKSHTVKVLKR